MMKLDETFLWILFIISFTLNIALSNNINNIKSMAVERGCASYNSTDGQFEWEAVK